MNFDEQKWAEIEKQWAQEDADEELPALPAEKVMELPTLDFSQSEPSAADTSEAVEQAGKNALRIRAPEAESQASPATRGAGQAPPSSMQSPSGQPRALFPQDGEPDWKGIGERLKWAELAKGSSETYENAFANAGSMGAYRPNAAAGEAGVAVARQPLEMAQAKQGYEQREANLGATRAKSAANAADRDPNSLQSQKARAAMKAFFGDLKLPEGSDNWSAADWKQFADSGTLARVASMKNAQADDQRKVAGAEQKAAGEAATLEAQRKNWASELKKAGIDPSTATAKDIQWVLSKNHTAATERLAEGNFAIANAGEKRKAADEAGGDIPPGHEITPGSNPGTDSRKKYTALVASQQKMRELTAAMREELSDASVVDRVMPGEKKRRLQQLATQMRIEAKNVAELGALSGPDMGLMEAMATDPTSLASFASGSLDKNLDGLDAWADSSVRAGGKAYGIQRKVSGGDMVQMKFPNGRTAPVPKADVEEAKKMGGVPVGG